MPRPIFVIAFAVALALAPMMSGCLDALRPSGDEDGADVPFDEDPVVFLHGCPVGGTNAEAAEGWDTAIAFFRDRGYPDTHLVIAEVPPPNCVSNEVYAQVLDEAVTGVLATTGSTRVDVVAHSMGGFAARLWLARGGHGVTESFVALAGANHGTHVGLGAHAAQAGPVAPPAYDGAREISPAYACEGQSPGDLQFEVNGCLTPNGRSADADETPGTTRYRSIYNTYDELISPVQSSCINQRSMNDCSDPANVEVTIAAPPNAAHSLIRHDPEVLAMVARHVTGEA